MWLLPLLLIVPNIGLDITETNYSIPARLANILLPAGLYTLISAWGTRIGRKILFFIPLMVLCAFQIVLLFLYGESIIAVDMFLNVATTNYHEATELLRNLGHAIATVLFLYLPLIGSGIWAEVRGARIPERALVIGRRTGLALTTLGLAAFGLAFTAGNGYRPTRELFPLNVVCNMFEAAERSAVTKNYPEKSASFRYHAIAKDEGIPADSAQIIVVIVGETSRSNHWGLGGYNRPTTPLLSARNNLVFYRKTLSESNTTHKSVPLLLSHLPAAGFNDSIYSTGCIVDAFKEAGYRTAWISNQAHNRSLIDYYSARADVCDYICDDPKAKAPEYDTELAPRVEKFIAGQPVDTRLFIVVHTYGSHFNYKERYPESDARFLPDNSAEASRDNREDLVNAYDNSILATDKAIDSILSVLERSGRPAVAVYASDHGEDIFDDDRERFLHASPCPTYYQIHVPMFVWVSGSYATLYPSECRTLEANREKNVSSSESLFHTTVALAHLAMPALKPELSLCSRSYKEPTRRYLNDYNESVPLLESGLKKEDIRILDRLRISKN